MRDRALWDRLAGYRFCLSSGMPLAEAIPREFNLLSSRAGPIMHEYRRLIYLVAISDDLLVAPPLLHAVWQFHAHDAGAYERDLGEWTIHRALPEPPTTSASGADPAYSRTLALYREAFGEAPPRTIWPSQGQLRRERTVEVLAMVALVFTVVAFVALASGAFEGDALELTALSAVAGLLTVIGLTLSRHLLGSWYARMDDS